jgi:hypothetical protein
MASPACPDASAACRARSTTPVTPPIETDWSRGDEPPSRGEVSPPSPPFMMSEPRALSCVACRHEQLG